METEEITTKSTAIHELILGLRIVQILLLAITITAAIGFFIPSANIGYLIAGLTGLFYEWKIEQKIKTKQQKLREIQEEPE